MDSDDEEEKSVSKVAKFPIQMYISEGNKYRRLAKYDTAILFFDAALEREPNNEKSLIGRATCNMRLAKFSEAKEDAEAVLRAHPKSCEAKMLIGEAEYFHGDFEKSFMTFYRGHAARSNHEGLRFGHQMCRRAIENTLQPDKPMTIDNQDLADLAELRDQDNEQAIKFKIHTDLFSNDVDFVNTLLNDDSVNSVHPHCEYLRMYLRGRQLFWKTQNPNTSKRNSVVSDSVDTKRRKDDSNTNESLGIDEKPSVEEDVEQKVASTTSSNKSSTSEEGHVSEQLHEESKLESESEERDTEEVKASEDTNKSDT